LWQVGATSNDLFRTNRPSGFLLLSPRIDPTVDSLSGLLDYRENNRFYDMK
jgi:hypothetical protein